jgi:hypothetical protein
LEILYFSDTQWSEKEKQIYLELMFKKILDSVQNNNYVIINGDIGDKGNLMDEIFQFFLQNKDFFKNYGKKIIINFGNHDDVLKAQVYRHLFEKEGLDNVILTVEPTLLDLEGKNFLFVPGAHEITGPGTFAKNSFYDENGNLLPSGYYLIENGKKSKLDENMVKEVAKALYIPGYYENFIKDSSKTQEEKDKLSILISKLLNEDAKIYYHVNSKELVEKYRDKNIFGIISHDPINYNPKLGMVSGLYVEKDFLVPIKIKLDEGYKEFQIKIPKGEYTKWKFYNYISNELVKLTNEEPQLANLLLNKIGNPSNLADKIINYFSKKDLIKEKKVSVADPYLKELDVKFHLGGHIEGKWYVLNKDGKIIFPKESTDSLYGNIHTRRIPIYQKDDNFYYVLPNFEVKDNNIYYKPKYEKVNF